MSDRKTRSPANKIVWTPEMDAALREGVAEREWLAVVADQIGVARGTARKRMRELGLEMHKRCAKPKPPASPARDAKELAFADLLANGLSPSQAGAQLGYARGNSVLQSIRKKLGWQAV